MKLTVMKTVAGTVMLTTLWLATYEISEAARRGGGGGGRAMSRGGPAMGGSMHRSQTRPQSSSRAGSMDRSRNPSRSQVNNRAGDRQISDQSRQNASDRRDQRQDNLSDRQDNRQDRYDDRQDNRDDRYDDRKEYYNDRQEWYEDSWRRGRYITAVRWGSVGCANVVIVNGIRYYDCGGIRYEQVYRGGEVTYIIVN